MKQKQRGGKKGRDMAPIFILVITIVAAALVGIGLTRSIGSSSAQEAAPTEVAPPAEQADTHDHGAESTVKRVTVQELRAQLDQGSAVVVDVRDLGGFASGHIPGSLHMPLETLESQLAMLPRDKSIVAYCT